MENVASQASKEAQAHAPERLVVMGASEVAEAENDDDDDAELPDTDPEEETWTCPDEENVTVPP